MEPIFQAQHFSFKFIIKLYHNQNNNNNREKVEPATIETFQTWYWVQKIELISGFLDKENSNI